LQLAACSLQLAACSLQLVPQFNLRLSTAFGRLMLAAFYHFVKFFDHFLAIRLLLEPRNRRLVSSPDDLPFIVMIGPECFHCLDIIRSSQCSDFSWPWLAFVISKLIFSFIILFYFPIVASLWLAACCLVKKLASFSSCNLTPDPLLLEAVRFLGGTASCPMDQGSSLAKYSIYCLALNRIPRSHFRILDPRSVDEVL